MTAKVQASSYNHHHFFLNSYLTFLFLVNNNVQTRSQLENLSKDEVIDEVLSLKSFKNDINSKFSQLNDCFNNFEAKYEMVNFNLLVSRLVMNFYSSILCNFATLWWVNEEENM